MTQREVEEPAADVEDSSLHASSTSSSVKSKSLKIGPVGLLLSTRKNSGMSGMDHYGLGGVNTEDYCSLKHLAV